HPDHALHQREHINDARSARGHQSSEPKDDGPFILPQDFQPAQEHHHPNQPHRDDRTKPTHNAPSLPVPAPLFSTVIRNPASGSPTPGFPLPTTSGDADADRRGCLPWDAHSV